MWTATIDNICNYIIINPAQKVVQMSLCPVCGYSSCDHTPKQRGQTEEETHRNLTTEEQLVCETGDTAAKLKLAKQNAHLKLIGEKVGRVPMEIDLITICFI